MSTLGFQKSYQYSKIYFLQLQCSDLQACQIPPVVQMMTLIIFKAAPEVDEEEEAVEDLVKGKYISTCQLAETIIHIDIAEDLTI